MVSWSTTGAILAAALAVIPVAYLAHKKSIKAKEQTEALKLLRKVELIVAEVSVRLMHLENQVEDVLANEGQSTDEAANQSTLNSCAHCSSDCVRLRTDYLFDSNGNKLKTKWDTYNVDAELEKLDTEDDKSEAAMEPQSEPQAPRPAARQPKNTMSKSKMLSAVGGLEHEFEAVLEFLDSIRGNDVVKQARKALASKITSELFSRIDALRNMLQ
ncbi:TPA: hypothetical protein N0F65_002806 [Lagenidium giganteum]|uniref:BAG domain-containing protein n=1 Tax=Lagenidium giganteum TaxID=4803 RepID=A0AAV2Z8X0_9STRA|nr:TPA: hypothetical protein N0F65_002806 [Lagenidium giganteum]